MTNHINTEKINQIFSEQLADEKYTIEEGVLESQGEELPFFQLLHPWNDNTLSLAVPLDESNARELASTLSKVELPAKYSALYHKDDEWLEVLWTAFKVRSQHEEVASREFSVWWRGTKRICRFGATSDEALTVARSCLPYAAESHTQHRNIMSFHYFAHDPETQGMADVPVSFWIDCKGLSQDEIEDYVRSINHYMTYYDRETPVVLIHDVGHKESSSIRPRYVENEFPKEIVAGEVDSSVAAFWLGVFGTADPSMKYLLHYRLIEYLALSHLKESQQRELIEILRRPHLLSTKEIAAAEITRLLSIMPRETDRMKNFIEDAVSKDKVWRVLELNRQLFSEDTEFDGGFRVKAILNQGMTCETWSSGPRGLVDRLRAIRNCMAHGQDEGTKGVIHATGRNRVLLKPWVNLIETFSAESMLYSRRAM